MFPSLPQQCRSNMKGADKNHAERRALRWSQERSRDLAFHANEFVRLVLKIHNAQGKQSVVSAATSLVVVVVVVVGGQHKLLTGVLCARPPETSVGTDQGSLRIPWHISDLPWSQSITSVARVSFITSLTFFT